jgi:hypothetical protein
MTETIRLSAGDIRRLREIAERIARRDSSAARFAIEIAERVSLVTGDAALNILAISQDPDWADTDLNQTFPWSRIRDMLVNARALFDLYIYERPGIGETGDLVCCVQAELDGQGLVAVHADSARDVWRRSDL